MTSLLADMCVLEGSSGTGRDQGGDEPGIRAAGVCLMDWREVRKVS